MSIATTKRYRQKSTLRQIEERHDSPGVEFLPDGRRVFRDRQAFESWRAETKRREAARAVRKAVEASVLHEEVPRILVGDFGWWIEPHETLGDGRIRFTVHDPAGATMAIVRGTEAEATRACEQLISTGKISR